MTRSTSQTDSCRVGERQCWWCDRTFVAKPVNKLTCSAECRAEYRSATRSATRGQQRSGNQRTARPWPDVIRSMAKEDARLAGLFLEALNNHRTRRGATPVEVPTP